MLPDLSNRFAWMLCTAFIFYLALPVPFWSLAGSTLLPPSSTRCFRSFLCPGLRYPLASLCTGAVRVFIIFCAHENPDRRMRYIRITIRLPGAPARNSESELVVVACVNTKPREIKPAVLSLAIQSVGGGSQRRKRKGEKRPAVASRRSASRRLLLLQAALRERPTDGSGIRWIVATLPGET